MMGARRVTAALSVVAATIPGTHLSATSPAIPGTSPDERPTRTICGLPITQLLHRQPVWDVECTACLISSTAFWQMPSWT